MSLIQIIKIAFQRIYQAKFYVFAAYLGNLILAAIPGLMLASELQGSIGASLAGDKLRRGFDDLWFRHFEAGASGISETFDPSIVGIGAIFNGIDVFLSGNFFSEYGAIVAFGVLYWGFWIFLAAGFISVFLRNDSAVEKKTEFMKGAGENFLRFLLLGSLAGVIYVFVFGALFPLLTTLVNSLTREMVDERTVFNYTVAKYAIIWIIVLSINFTFDYAKIITASKRLTFRTVIAAPAMALRFFRRNLFKVIAFYAVNGIFWFAILGLYWLISSGAWQSSWFTIVFAFLIGQVYICLLYTSPSPRDGLLSRMPSSA